MLEVICSPETGFLKQPHGVTSQNTAFFSVTAVKTSNLIQNLSFNTDRFLTPVLPSYVTAWMPKDTGSVMLSPKDLYHKDIALLKV
jgi:hypothetical protein